MRSSMKHGMFVWVVVGAIGCSGEPAVQADAAIEDTSDVTEVPDTLADTHGDSIEDIDTDTFETNGDAQDVDTTPEVPDTRADTADTAVPDIEDTDTQDVDTTSEVPDTHADTADTTVPDTEAPDTFTEVTDTATPDTVVEVPDTTPDTTTPDTYTPLCDAVTTTYQTVPSPYAPVCSALTFTTDPPTSGPHYPVWATYKTYGVPVNPGFLVHSLKHGAIVITWRCPNGCIDELVELREMLNRRPADRMCDPLLKHRIIVAPRPDQDAMLVASAWGASWKAPCFDLVALEAFIDARYGQGLENECFEGVDVEKVRPDNAWYCPP